MENVMMLMMLLIAFQNFSLQMKINILTDLLCIVLEVLVKKMKMMVLQVMHNSAKQK